MYKRYPLLYGFSDLEPYIDTHTLGLHYNKHQLGYLNKLHQLLEKNNYHDEYPIELLSYHISEFPKEDQEDILFNLGGVLNHNIYFKSISKNKIMPSPSFEEQLKKQFQSLENFKKIWKENALKVKGSGYTYLVIDRDKTLKVMNFLNQDCPYFYELIPLLCIDVWEHAYYINYENKRDLYIDNFLEIIDFSYANQIYEMFISKQTNNLSSN